MENKEKEEKDKERMKNNNNNPNPKKSSRFSSSFLSVPFFFSSFFHLLKHT